MIEVWAKGPNEKVSVGARRKQAEILVSEKIVQIGLNKKIR